MSEEAKPDQEPLFTAIKALQPGTGIILRCHAVVRTRDGAWVVGRLSCDEPYLQTVFDADEACVYAKKWRMNAEPHLLQPTMLPPNTNELDYLGKVLSF